MSELTKRLDAQEAMTPDEGWRVVGIDDYEAPGEELYAISDHDTRAEADAALKKAQARSPGEKMHVYGNRDKQSGKTQAGAAKGGSDMDAIDKLGAMGAKPGKKPPGAMGAPPGSPGAKPGAMGAQPGAKPGAPPGSPGAKPGAMGAKPGAPGQKPGAMGAEQPDAATQYATKIKNPDTGESTYEYLPDEQRDPQARFVVDQETPEGAHWELPHEADTYDAFKQWKSARKQGLSGTQIPRSLVEGALGHAAKHHFDGGPHKAAYDDYQAHQATDSTLTAPPSHSSQRQNGQSGPGSHPSMRGGESPSNDAGGQGKPPGAQQPPKKQFGKSDAIDALGDLSKAAGDMRAGHKYKSRTADGKGGWVYDYGDKKGKGAGGKSDPMDAVTHRDKHSVVTYFKDPYYAKLILAHVKSTPKYADTAAIKDYGRGYAVQYYPSGPYYPEREPGKMHDPFGVRAVSELLNGRNGTTQKSFDAIDALRDLSKAAGDMRAGHKYKTRTADGKGGWVYTYADDAAGAAELANHPVPADQQSATRKPDLGNESEFRDEYKRSATRKPDLGNESEFRDEYKRSATRKPVTPQLPDAASITDKLSKLRVKGNGNSTSVDLVDHEHAGRWTATFRENPDWREDKEHPFVLTIEATSVTGQRHTQTAAFTRAQVQTKGKSPWQRGNNWSMREDVLKTFAGNLVSSIEKTAAVQAVRNAPTQKSFDPRMNVREEPDARRPMTLRETPLIKFDDGESARIRPALGLRDFTLGQYLDEPVITAWNPACTIHGDHMHKSQFNMRAQCLCGK